MKVTKEISLSNFEAWSGGKDTVDALTSDQLDTIESNLNELYPDGMDETELNDFLWFERETIAEWLGYKSVDAMFGYEEEDDDEEDEEKEPKEGISYGEIAALEEEFNKQCLTKHIDWTDEEVRQEALNQFISDYEDGDEDPQVLLNGYGYFEYPPTLTRQMEMFKEAKKISNDSEIFNGRKALLEKHFNEHPIYLDDTYYAHSDKWPMVEESQLAHLSEWRDCHYYSLYEWQGHRFFVMTGGRYD